MKKRIAAEAERDDLREKYESARDAVARFKKKGGIDSHEKPSDAPPAAPVPVPKLPDSPAAPAPAAKVTHVRAVTDQFCADCGEKNPDFKDETECVECGRPLGAISTLSKVKVCPGCGVGGHPAGDPRNKFAQRKKSIGAAISA